MPNKTLGVIGHDGKKADMVGFGLSHRERLLHYDLVATATTGKLLADKCDLPVQKLLSGPFGGDAQIAAMCAEGKVEAVVFFVEPLGEQAHDPDIPGLLRICDVHNIPLATNCATAVLTIYAQTPETRDSA